MLGRFRKKAIHEDTRAHYRKSPGRADAIGVKLICANGAPVSGAIVDLSAGGTAIEFTDDVSHDLEIDEVRQLVFSSLTRSSVRAWGQVRALPTESHPSRYGFMFLETGELFEQLDESFYKFFNRRRFRRAKPALGQRFKADICFGNVVETAAVHDVSLGGVSVMISPDLASSMYVDMPVELTLHVPKTDFELKHYAIVRHLTPEGSQVRVGMSMEVVEESDSKRHLAKARAALADYIQRRVDEMDRYNSAYA